MVALLRRHLGVQRVGHTGTLDPFASGLLVILLGKATRLARFVVGLDKRYRGVIRLGTRTRSLDRTGEIVETNDRWNAVTDAQLQNAMSSLVGTISQQPPQLSAKKVAGQPAYRRVRRGETVEMQPHRVRVDSFRMVSRSGSDVGFEASVGTGTYIRSLARDLGDALKCGAHVRELRRVSVGTFSVADAVAPECATLADTRPAAELVAHLPSVHITAEERIRVCHGGQVDTTLSNQGNVAVFAGEELVAVADAVEGAIKPRVVLGEA